MTTIRLTQLDGSLPNLALMNLHSWAKQKGHTVRLIRNIHRQPEDLAGYDAVWGSAIFLKSADVIQKFKQNWPNAVVGGTGAGDPITAESLTGEVCDSPCYDGYPEFRESIGFTQRGCRLSCKFCVVPLKEGKPKSVKTIYDIWRGDPWPKKLHLLDNDFFGQPEWRARISEIIEGEFRVCLSQGINVRMITEESAAALASIQYRDTRFKERRLYTAWDNFRDGEIFFKGVELLRIAGVPAKHLMAYMLVGYDPTETWERIWERFLRMTTMGIQPFPMVYDRTRIDLISFQRWACRGLYRIIKWPDYIRRTKSQESVDAYQVVASKIITSSISN